MLRYSLLFINILIASVCYAAAPTEQVGQTMDEPGAVFFTPPEGWRMAEPNQLPPNVKVMVVGQGDHNFAPSINLTVEPFKGTLKQYLKIVKNINDSRGAAWQDLGTIRTQAGNGNLSQVDVKTEWGDSRMMHVILLKNNNVYILTAAALREEFPRFYKEFFNALRSLHINKNVYEMVSNPKKRADLEKAVAEVKSGWEDTLNNNTHPNTSLDALFTSDTFQNTYWKPFQEKLSKDHKDMSPNWRQQIQSQTQNEFLSGGASPRSSL